ncbi:hypothetical protein MTO96_009213 [Rhipicephalus appendiculatus]
MNACKCAASDRCELFRCAGFHTSTFEAASGSTSQQHEQEETSPSCWEELRRRGEVAADQNFDDFVNADADADTDATEVLDDEEIACGLFPAHKRSLKMRTIRMPSKLPCPHTKPGDGPRRPS